MAISRERGKRSDSMVKRRMVNSVKCIGYGLLAIGYWLWGDDKEIFGLYCDRKTLLATHRERVRG